MAQKPSIPKGTRDFGPAEMARRNYIFDTIRSVYALYGFQQIETPAMENLSTLMGKYGEEGDKLLFKILNSGDFLKPLSNSPRGGENLLSSLLEANGNDALPQTGRGALAAQLCEKGLRYDLTVPFARYVVQHREELTMPFRRYQVQPVWRADRPQKGRYREFYQFDGDVVGSDSLLNEVELMQIIDEVFRRFGIRVCIKINNRKILTGIAEIIGQADKIVDITVAIDKLDKIGLDNVNAELAEAGIPAEAIERLQPIIKLSGTNEEKLATMRAFFGSPAPAQAEGEGADHPAAGSQVSETGLKVSETGLKGCDEVEFVLSALRSVVGGLSADVELDLTLARGLNYYTGCIFEVKALDVEIGSITGGGRYDNLTGIFGMPGLSGVGISFGIDRIFDVLNALDAYPAAITTATQLLFVNFGEAEAAYALPAVAAARRAGIRTEIFPDAAKMKKQMQYANARAIPFVALAGETEMAAGTFTLKNMTTGEQSTVTTEQLIAAVLP
ncbi:MAG: histidine--tRNA ligase [Bacteroidaceae bacterium]|nr:histidine--tRNA ligase [Bacteroidaceae bacterium]